jgi:hypothetical protein
MKTYYVVCNFGCVEKTYEGFFYATRLAEDKCKHGREQYVLDIQQYKNFKQYMRNSFHNVLGEHRVIVEKGQVKLRIENGQIKPFLWTDTLIFDIDDQKKKLQHELKLEADRKWVERHGFNPDEMVKHELFVQRDIRVAKRRLEELKAQFGLDELRKVLEL